MTKIGLLFFNKDQTRKKAVRLYNKRRSMISTQAS